MIPHECPPERGLEEILRLDPADPRRAALEECPRCQARLLLFRSFLEPGGQPAGADLQDARRRLSRALAAEFRPSATSRNEARRSRFSPPSWLGWRPALGLATAMAVVALVLYFRAGPPVPHIGALSPTGSGNAVRLRAEPSGPRSPAEIGPVLLPVQAGANGSLVLRWTRVPKADAYVVLFHAMNLTEILRLEAGPDTSLAIPPATAARLGARGENVLWSVSARAEGDEIAASAPAAIRIP